MTPSEDGLGVFPVSLFQTLKASVTGPRAGQLGCRDVTKVQSRLRRLALGWGTKPPSPGSDLTYVMLLILSSASTLSKLERVR